MVKFSRANISRSKYVVRGIQRIVGSENAVLPVISAAQVAAKPNVDASEITSFKTNVGVSCNVYDVQETKQGQLDPEVDLGIIYSNGFRYQYLAFKANNGLCDITFNDTVIPVTEQTEAGIITYDVFYPGYTITAAYNGNDVVPPLPPNNTPTNTNPPPSKVPFVPSNINC